MISGVAVTGPPLTVKEPVQHSREAAIASYSDVGAPHAKASWGAMAPRMRRRVASSRKDGSTAPAHSGMSADA